MLGRFVICAAAVLVVGGAAAATENSLHLDIERGATMGSETRVTYTEADGTFQAAQFGGGGYVAVYFRGDNGGFWSMQLTAPPGQTLTPGVYDAASSFSPLYPTSPHISVTSECVLSYGTFEIHEFQIDAATGSVVAFRARFESRCVPTGPATTGEVRFRSAAALRVTTPLRVVAPRGRAVEFPVTVDGSLASDSRIAVQGLPDGASLTDHGDGTGTFRWIPPIDRPLATIDLRFEATATDGSVGAATTKLVIRGATWLRLRSEAGSWVGGGVNRGFKDTDGLFFSYVHPVDSNVWLQFRGWEAGRFWTLVFGGPNHVELTPGTYSDAVDWTNPDLSRPKLSVGGEGSSCNHSSGYFEIREMTKSLDGSVASFWATFVQRCDGSESRLAGEIRLNADTPPNRPPVAEVSPTIVAECTGPNGTRVDLHGAGSYDPDGDLVELRWSAENVTFDDPTRADTSATFPLGTTLVTLSISDGLETSFATVEVVVADSRPPTLRITPTPAVLSPANGAMQDVSMAVQVIDTCDAHPSWWLESVTSSEPADRGGVDVAEAALGSPDTVLLLRATRDGRGTGRDYTVTYHAHDAAGNLASATATVTVPHDRRP